MRGSLGDLSTATRPPTTIPLAHVLVALGFLLAGATVWLFGVMGVEIGHSAYGEVAVAHLLLVGWVCLTILGAMTQFVPVWSGVELYSTRLATLQLACVAVGIAGFAGALGAGLPADGVVFAFLAVLGFAVFVYTLGRTLWRARPLDVTEGHFALALGCFALAVVLGGLLVADFRWRILVDAGLTRVAVIDAHVTLALFGGVVATVVGALYQLGPMFTQSDPTTLDARLCRVECLTLPVGVLLLAAGRLTETAAVATAGGLLLAAGVLCSAVVLLRRLRSATVSGTPMIPRYAVVAVTAAAWAVTAAVTWVAQPLGPAARFGHPDVGVILLGALVGFVVVGTLYHVVPFIVWLDVYSDRVGFERVPAIDDLYDDRVARVDLAATVSGAGVLLVAALSAVPVDVGPVSSLTALGGAMVVAGVFLFVGNVVRTIVVHAGALLVERGGEASDTSSVDRQ